MRPALASGVTVRACVRVLIAREFVDARFRTDRFAPAVGRAADRYGARRLLGAGAILLAVTLLAIGAVTEPWQLYVLFPVMSLGFSMGGSIPASALLARWFVTRRAIAMSLSSLVVTANAVRLLRWTPAT